MLGWPPGPEARWLCRLEHEGASLNACCVVHVFVRSKCGNKKKREKERGISPKGKRESKGAGSALPLSPTMHAGRPLCMHWATSFERRTLGRRSSSAALGYLRRVSATSVAWPRFPVRLPEPRNARSEQAMREKSCLSQYASSSRREWLSSTIAIARPTLLRYVSLFGE